MRRARSATRPRPRPPPSCCRGARQLLRARLHALCVGMGVSGCAASKIPPSFSLSFSLLCGGFWLDPHPLYPFPSSPLATFIAASSSPSSTPRRAHPTPCCNPALARAAVRRSSPSPFPPPQTEAPAITPERAALFDLALHPLVLRHGVSLVNTGRCGPYPSVPARTRACVHVDIYGVHRAVYGGRPGGFALQRSFFSTRALPFISFPRVLALERDLLRALCDCFRRDPVARRPSQSA